MSQRKHMSLTVLRFAQQYWYWTVVYNDFWSPYGAEALCLRPTSCLLILSPNYVSELSRELCKKVLFQSYWIRIWKIGIQRFVCVLKVIQLFLQHSHIWKLLVKSFLPLFLRCCYRFRVLLFSGIIFNWWFSLSFLKNPF